MARLIVSALVTTALLSGCGESPADPPRRAEAQPEVPEGCDIITDGLAIYNNGDLQAGIRDECRGLYPRLDSFYDNPPEPYSFDLGYEQGREDYHFGDGRISRPPEGVDGRSWDLGYEIGYEEAEYEDNSRDLYDY